MRSGVEFIAGGWLSIDVQQLYLVWWLQACRQQWTNRCVKYRYNEMYFFVLHMYVYNFRSSACNCLRREFFKVGLESRSRAP